MSHADPALWVVRDADTTVYLFGTIHVLKPGLAWFGGEVRSAFDKSDELVLELVAPPDEEMAALVRELGEIPGPATLPQQLPPATVDRMRKALAGLGQPPEMVDHEEPWLAAITLSNLPIAALGYDSDQGVESTLAAEAQRTSKRVTGLETAREQLGYFDRLSPAAQRALLDQAIDGVPTAGKTLETAIDEWRKGDADALARLVNDDVRDSPEAAHALIEERNRRWSDWIVARMAKPGTVFVAVGAGHLAGPIGLQTMLAKRGLKVARIRY